MLLIYSLENCPYYRKAEDLVKEHEIPHKIIKITHTTKQKYKRINKMDTFPQIFIETKSGVKRDKKQIKLGGSQVLLHLIQISHLIRYNELSLYKVKEFMKEY